MDRRKPLPWPQRIPWGLILAFVVAGVSGLYGFADIIAYQVTQAGYVSNQAVKIHELSDRVWELEHK